MNFFRGEKHCQQEFFFLLQGYSKTLFLDTVLSQTYAVYFLAFLFTLICIIYNVECDAKTEDIPKQ